MLLVAPGLPLYPSMIIELPTSIFWCTCRLSTVLIPSAAFSVLMGGFCAGAASETDVAAKNVIAAKLNSVFIKPPSCSNLAEKASSLIPDQIIPGGDGLPNEFLL